MRRRSQVFLSLGSIVCALFVATLLARAALSAPFSGVASASHIVLQQASRSDVNASASMIADESSDSSSDFESLSLFCGPVVIRTQAMPGFLDICYVPLGRDPSLVAQRIRLQI
jgi:hypothetical protein